jgi:hypothetical protein
MGDQPEVPLDPEATQMSTVTEEAIIGEATRAGVEETVRRVLHEIILLHGKILDEELLNHGSIRVETLYFGDGATVTLEERIEGLIDSVYTPGQHQIDSAMLGTVIGAALRGVDDGS